MPAAIESATTLDSHGGAPGGSAALDEAVRAQVERALLEAGGNKKRAAEILGISRSGLYNYLDRFKLR